MAITNEELIRRAMSVIGRKRTERKRIASQQNGQKGGRPAEYAPCAFPPHRFDGDVCQRCGLDREQLRDLNY